MTTGYTDAVGKGEITEFKDYALLCARAFGACVSMRDEPLDAEIPEEFKPNDYHEKSLQKARGEDNEFLKKSDDEVRELLFQDTNKYDRLN